MRELRTKQDKDNKASRRSSACFLYLYIGAYIGALARHNIILYTRVHRVEQGKIFFKKIKKAKKIKKSFIFLKKTLDNILLKWYYV